MPCPSPAAPVGGVRLGAGEREHLEAVAAPVALGREEAVNATADVAEARGAEGEREQQHRRGGHQPAPRDARAGERRERHAERDGGRREIGLARPAPAPRAARARAPAAGMRPRPRRAAPGAGRAHAAAISSPVAPIRNGAGLPDSGPRCSQRLAPAARTPTPGTNTAAVASSAIDEQRRRQARARGRCRRARPPRRARRPPRRRWPAATRSGCGAPRPGAPWPRARAGDDREAQRAQPDGGNDQQARRRRSGGPSQKRRRKPMPASKRSPNSGCDSPVGPTK